MSPSNFILLGLTVLSMQSGNVFGQTRNSDPENVLPEPGAVNTTWRRPLTGNGGYDPVPIKDTKGTAIPWQPIREDDILWKRRVWREISATEKPNLAFSYAGDEHTGGGMLIEILTDAIRTGKIKAYANTDDRFTTHQF